MTTAERAVSQRVPDEIARAVILPESYGDPDGTVEPALRWLRDNLPLGLAELPGYDPIWLVTRHADCQTVLKDADLFHNADVNVMLLPQEGDEFLRQVLGGHTKVLEDLTYQEPPYHTKLRGALISEFTPVQIRRYEDHFRQIAKQVVDRMFDEAVDGEYDFVQLARVYPLHVVLSILGLPESEYPYILKLTEDTFGGDDDDLRRDDLEQSPEAMAVGMQEGWAEGNRYFDEIRRDRIAKPREDIATVIANAALPDGEAIPPKITNDLLIAVAVAGHHTTAAAIAGGMLGLCAFPENLDRVRDDPRNVLGLVEESLRWSTPAKHFTRNATATSVVAGAEIAEGDRLMILFNSANRDEDVFERPYEFDVSRRPNRQLSFAAGPHVCIGQHITRLEMKVLWEEILPRIASIELAGEPRYKSSNFVSGAKYLPITFTTA